MNRCPKIFPEILSTPILDTGTLRIHSNEKIFSLHYPINWAIF